MYPRSSKTERAICILINYSSPKGLHHTSCIGENVNIWKALFKLERHVAAQFKTTGNLNGSMEIDNSDP